jgi:hypothetical protein
MADNNQNNNNSNNNNINDYLSLKNVSHEKYNRNITSPNKKIQLVLHKDVSMELCLHFEIVSEILLYYLN